MYSRSIVRAFLARPIAFKRPLACNSSTVAAVFQSEPKPPVQGTMQVREDKTVGRDIVGYGINGEPTYSDTLTYPFPAVRFMKNTPEIMVWDTLPPISRFNTFNALVVFQALREKEKGDWKKLTIEEKKQLYRASFCQTLVEVEAPTGEWKAVFGWSFFWISVSLLSFVGVRKFCKCNIIFQKWLRYHCSFHSRFFSILFSVEYIWWSFIITWISSSSTQTYDWFTCWPNWWFILQMGLWKEHMEKVIVLLFCIILLFFFLWIWT